jgi:hypothetical protein
MTTDSLLSRRGDGEGPRDLRPRMNRPRRAAAQMTGTVSRPRTCLPAGGRFLRSGPRFTQTTWASVTVTLRDRAGWLLTTTRVVIEAVPMRWVSVQSDTSHDEDRLVEHDFVHRHGDHEPETPGALRSRRAGRCRRGSRRRRSCRARWCRAASSARGSRAHPTSARSRVPATTHLPAQEPAWVSWSDG